MKFNKEAVIYFSISWILALLLIPAFFYDKAEILLLFLALNFLNVFVNISAVIIMIFYAYIFSEKRIEFLSSAFLLLFNLPILSTSFFIIKLFIL